MVNLLKPPSVSSPRLGTVTGLWRQQSPSPYDRRALNIGYVGGTHISQNERKSRADALQSAGAQQVIERMHDLIGILSATPV
ncbi:MAG: hypothetical protein AB1589_18945 [Cyanobacteriota bacterium]